MIFKNHTIIKLICLFGILSSGLISTLTAEAQENSLTLALMEKLDPMKGDTDNFNAQRRKWLAEVRDQNHKAMGPENEIHIEELSRTCDVENKDLSRDLLISYMNKIDTERNSR